MNNEKVYGAVDGVNYSAGTETEAMNRLWRNIFSGCASSRFRRPIHSLTEAYVTAILGRQYAVYFPPGRFMVDLDPWVYVEELELRWLDIDNLTWSKPETVPVQWEGDVTDLGGTQGKVTLFTPSNRAYVALLEVI